MTVKKNISFNSEKYNIPSIEQHAEVASPILPC